ncbi:MAG: DUF1080 domain-containing protein [Cyclobacteriaceae bacterium]
MKRNVNVLTAVLLSASLLSCSSGKENQEEESNITIEETENDGFVSIFDGETLAGWDGDPTYWRVENGSIVGEITEETILDRNHFLIWQGGQPGDFELKTEFKISEEGNSGINYRSEMVEGIPFALRGYQADIDGRNRYTGQNYEERKRTTLAYIGQKTKINPQEKEGDLRANVEGNAWLGLEVTEELGARDSLSNLVKTNDWNTMHLVVKGNRLQHFVNGVLMSDVTDEDPANRSMKGYLGVQVHVGPPMQVAYRNISIKQ